MKRFKLASALNIIGLTTAFTACYVLLTQIEYACTYNSCIAESENVYRIESSGTFDDELTTAFPRPLADNIRKLPQVKEIFLGQMIGMRIGQVKKGKDFINIDDTSVFSDGLRLAHPKLLCGVDTLENEFDAIIPRSFAEKYFGETLVVGRHIILKEGHLTVKGVYEDFPENSSFQNNIYVHTGDENIDNMSNWNYNCFVRLVPGTDFEALAETIKKIYADYIWGTAEDHSDVTPEIKKTFEENIAKLNFRFRPIEDTYFSGVDDTDRGNRGVQLVLEIAVLMLLIVAGINFANFVLAETPMRIKGVNIRKVLGMSSTELRRGMILETVLTALVAFALSIGIDYLLSLSPWMQKLVVGTLALEGHPLLIIYIGTAAILIGILVGIYPAIYSTSFQPAIVLKGSFGLSPKGKVYRKVLVSVQLFVAFGLSIYISVLMAQSHFIHNSDYGFYKDEILYCGHAVKKTQFTSVRQELDKIPGVESIGFTAYVPSLNSGCMRWGRGMGDKNITLAVIPCDWNILRTMGIDIVEGRNFAENDKNVFIVNEATKNKYAWIDIDKELTENEAPVIGVCKNFRVFTTRENNNTEPASFFIFGEKYDNWDLNYCVVTRIGKNIDKIAAKKELDRQLKKMLMRKVDNDDIIPEFRFIDDGLQQAYEDEFRFIRQVELFSLICLLITLVGVFCLTMFETEYRRKEIGMRKVMGNSTSDIIKMFCRQYTLLLIIAFIFAAPVAYYMAEQWLQNFAERTPIHWWLWAVGFLIVSLVVLLTVSVQTWRTACENPTKNLKSE